ncbi:hypothetical protein D3C81_132720 [compost metagenome]
MFLISNRISTDNIREVCIMNTRKTLLTTLALGAAYLLKNKDVRTKLRNGVQSFTDQVKAKRTTGRSL